MLITIVHTIQQIQLRIISILRNFRYGSNTVECSVNRRMLILGRTVDSLSALKNYLGRMLRPRDASLILTGWDFQIKSQDAIREGDIMISIYQLTTPTNSTSRNSSFSMVTFPSILSGDLTTQSPLDSPSVYKAWVFLVFLVCMLLTLGYQPVSNRRYLFSVRLRLSREDRMAVFIPARFGDFYLSEGHG
jgi:hypothetical protein